MKRILVNGGRRLSGDVVIGGSKNAALPVLFGGIATGEACVFSNLPRVSDVLQTLEILKFLGARICFLTNGDVRVDYSTVEPKTPPATLTSPIRGSTYLLGAMLARFGRAGLAGVGGCDFGSRPIDQHLMGFARLGAEVECGENELTLTAPNGLCGTTVHLAMPSVGATANLLLAASLAAGETVIENAAAEPHVAALAAFLQDAGALIEGVGTNRILVRGVRALHGARHTVIPDMIEAGTYLCAGLACGGPIRVRSVNPSHLGCVIECFRAMGARVQVGANYISVGAHERYRCIDIVTGPFPGFPTDLHPQFAALFCLGNRAGGAGSVEERVFLSRFRYTEELARMGACIRVEGSTAHIEPHALRGARMRSPDLRGGAALLLAALATPGESEIGNAYTVGRGYEHLESKLRSLGAQIRVF